MGKIDIKLAWVFLEWLQGADTKFTISYSKGVVPHDAARNQLAWEFLQSDADYLLMVDADITPPKNILDMINHDVPVVAGMCLVDGREDIVTTAAREEEIDGQKTIHAISIRDFPKDVNPIPVDFVGAGCLLIRRDVLQTMMDKGLHPFRFEYEPFNKEKAGIPWRGEDYYFCHLARSLGFQTYIDRTMLCEHNKNVDLVKMNELIYKGQKQGSLSPAYGEDRRTTPDEDPPTPRGTA